MNLKSDLPVPEKRPLLIHNHNAKAGGGSIIKILKEAKKCKIDNKHQYRKKLKEKGNNLDWKIDCFVEITEKQSTKYEDRKEGFIIGSIREPCDQYVSLFTYASNHNGGVWNYANRHESLGKYIGTNGPMFNSSSDIKKFHEFLKHPKIFGRVHNQLNRNYRDNKELEVDCWVYVDDFQVSLYQCLRQYEMQGGYLDWDSPLLLSLMNEAKDILSQRGLKEHKHSKIKDKNDPIGNPQSLHHAPCETYFDEESMKMIEEKDSIVYNTFGYEGCCKGRKHDANYFNDTIIKSMHILSRDNNAPVVHETTSYHKMSENILFCFGSSLGLLMLYVAASSFLRRKSRNKDDNHRYNRLTQLTDD